MWKWKICFEVTCGSGGFVLKWLILGGWKDVTRVCKWRVECVEVTGVGKWGYPQRNKLQGIKFTRCTKCTMYNFLAGFWSGIFFGGMGYPEKATSGLRWDYRDLKLISFRDVSIGIWSIRVMSKRLANSVGNFLRTLGNWENTYVATTSLTTAPVRFAERRILKHFIKLCHNIKWFL